MGMVDEHHIEFIPVHRTAFAKRMELAVCHPDEGKARSELSGLLELICAERKRARRSKGNRAEASAS